MWRPVESGIDVSAFHQFNDATWDGVEAEARSLAALLADREPSVYSRHANWWSKITAVQTRTIEVSG